MFVPTTFGKYFLTEHLATGGMAEIYRGKLLGPGGFEKQLVIKQIHPKLGARREFVDLFVAEAKTTVSLSHGNIVPIFELGVVDGTYFIAMEYVDGPTLAELWRLARTLGRRLGPPMAATICAEILKGLDYAHRRGGLIHRDLSPRNVIVSRNGEVKILDFGLAATFENAAALSKLSSGGGRPVGSFPYMSPEQAARAPLDARSDVFSAGILLWEMLTGDTLFGRHDEDTTLAAVRDAPIPPPSQRAREVPPELDALVGRALERDVARRWASAADFLSGLGRYLYSVEPQVTPAAISSLVAEICPDVPLASGSAEAAAPAPEPAGPVVPQPGGGTRPMARATTEERSFATHVELERALERNRTPLMPMPAFDSLVRAQATPAPAPAPPLAEGTERRARLPAPPARRRGRVALYVLGVVGVASAAGLVALRPARDDRPAKVSLGAPPGLDAGPPPGAPADAGPPPGAIASPDAAPAPPPTPVDAPPGRLIVSTPEVAWASVFLDGKRIGETPLPAPGHELPAGKHTLRLVCEPEVCPPDGKQKTLSITVPPGGTVERPVRF